MVGRRPDAMRTVTHGMKCAGSSGPSCFWRDVAGNFTSLPQHFKQSGYYAVSFGKVYDQRTANGTTCDYPLSWSEKPMYCSTAGTTLTCLKGVPCPLRLSHWIYNASQVIGNLTDVQTADAAVAWLGRRAQKTKKAKLQPFFMAVGFHRPHLPWIVDQASLDANPPDKNDQPPPNNFAPDGMPIIAWTDSDEFFGYGVGANMSGSNGSYGKFQAGGVNQSLTFPRKWTAELRRFYKAAVTHTDTMIRRVLASLDATGERDNTIIALWGDHGWHIGEQGLWGKCTLFEVATRAPMLLSVPGLAAQAMSISALSEHVDLFPTLSELAEISVPPPCDRGGMQTALCTQGTSLVPLLSGSAQAVRNASFSLWPNPAVGSRRQCKTGQYAPVRGSTPEPCAATHGNLQFPGLMGYSMVAQDGRRYTEWVNMSYPDGAKPGGRWVPLWNETRDVEYYLTESNVRNAAVSPPPDAATRSAMAALSAQLRNAWTLQAASSTA